MDGVLALILILAVGAMFALLLDFTILWKDRARARRRSPGIEDWREEFLVGEPLVQIETTQTLDHPVRMRLVPTTPAGGSEQR